MCKAFIFIRLLKMILKGYNPSSSAKWQQKTASSLLERGFLLALCIARRRREGCRRSRNPGGRGIVRWDTLDVAEGEIREEAGLP